MIDKRCSCAISALPSISHLRRGYTRDGLFSRCLRQYVWMPPRIQRQVDFIFTYMAYEYDIIHTHHQIHTSQFNIVHIDASSSGERIVSTRSAMGAKLSNLPKSLSDPRRWTPTVLGLVWWFHLQTILVLWMLILGLLVMSSNLSTMSSNWWYDREVFKEWKKKSQSVSLVSGLISEKYKPMSPSEGKVSTNIRTTAAGTVTWGCRTCAQEQQNTTKTFPGNKNRYNRPVAAQELYGQRTNRSSLTWGWMCKKPESAGHTERSLICRASVREWVARSTRRRDITLLIWKRYIILSSSRFCRLGLSSMHTGTPQFYAKELLQKLPRVWRILLCSTSCLYRAAHTHGQQGLHQPQFSFLGRCKKN